SGPYAGYRAHHLNVFHAGGEGHLLPSGLGWTQFPERPPLQVGSDAGDYDTGASAAVAVLAAYLRQQETGRGEGIAVSAQESQLTLTRPRLSRFNHDGVELRRAPSPYAVGGMYRCGDGYVQILAAQDDYWRRLADTPGGAPFGDARFATVAARN